MRFQLARLQLALVLAVGTLTFSAQAHEAKFVCKKDGAHVKAAGAGDTEQKADCEKQGGTWEKHQHDGKHEEKKQSAGGGGGW